MGVAGTMPCYTCRDAFTSGSLRPSQPARTRLRGALIISGSPSRRRAAPQYAARRFQSGSRASSRFTQLVHVACRYAMPVASEGGGIAHGLIGSRFRIRLPVPVRLLQRRPALVDAYDASLVENTMNRPLTSTSGLVLSTSPEHWVSLL